MGTFDIYPLSSYMGVIGYGHPSHNGSPYSETVRYDGYILDIYGGINMRFFLMAHIVIPKDRNTLW